ncbi:hypothetical protein OZX69_09695 (plasmid) [Lactobacillus sp. ESL0731]|uniref:hypothetical protein n=1 Tax=unclassified Lactobacillus TaxID=2620435 RepID=UPI0023F71A5C|nr:MULTISPECIES: hypothetical protein [unclassified Lactobacillus]WEV52084.1 hypothetical protein OZX63_09630 [Lactobacillus sp. ESL0700]WEV63225.1 hypothetical protein OZX69_09695 [Lactobacillus sp. ESL0731]
MSSFELILFCAFFAYLLMKIREYTLAAKKLKTDMFSEKDKTATLGAFKDKLKVLDVKLSKLHEAKRNLEVQPVSHKIKKRLHKLDMQIAKMEQTKDGYAAAFAEYQELINSESNNSKFRDTLRSYLNNKYHL